MVILKQRTQEMAQCIFGMVKCKRFYILPHNLICFLFNPDFGSPDKEHNDSLQSSYQVNYK